MSVLLAVLTLLVGILHFHLYLESNGLVEAYQLIAIILVFSKNAETTAYFIMEGLLILLMNFDIKFGNDYFYRYSNLHFIGRNNLLVYN
jgi:hypothetical protein